MVLAPKRELLTILASMRALHLMFLLLRGHFHSHFLLPRVHSHLFIPKWTFSHVFALKKTLLLMFLHPRRHFCILLPPRGHFTPCFHFQEDTFLHLLGITRYFRQPCMGSQPQVWQTLDSRFISHFKNTPQYFYNLFHIHQPHLPFPLLCQGASPRLSKHVKLFLLFCRTKRISC